MRTTCFIFAIGFSISSLCFRAGGITTAACLIGAVAVASMVAGFLAVDDEGDEGELS